MSSLLEIKNAIQESNETFDLFQKAQEKRVDDLKAAHTKEVAELRDRVEELESTRSMPRGTSASGKPIEYKEFFTPSGVIYDLPSTTQLADVVRPQKKAEVSLDRWIAALVAGERCGDKIALEYVRDTKQILTTSTGVLIPEEFQSQWIDRLRSQMVLNAAGIRTRTMDAKILNASAIATDPSASWHSENGSISANNPTFEARSMTARTLVCRCQASAEVAQDSPDFGAQLGRVMTRAIAQEVDRVGLEGSGTPPEPSGLKNTSGINQVSSVGTPTDYTKIISAVQLLLGANVSIETATKNLILSPYAWARYENLVTGLSGDKSQLKRPQSIENTAFRVTGAIADGSPISSTMYMGDFGDLILGIRREAAIEILKLTTYASNLLLEFVAYGRFDFLVTRPASFVKLTGLT